MCDGGVAIVCVGVTDPSVHFVILNHRLRNSRARHIPFSPSLFFSPRRRRRFLMLPPLSPITPSSLDSCSERKHKKRDPRWELEMLDRARCQCCDVICPLSWTNRWAFRGAPYFFVHTSRISFSFLASKSSIFLISLSVKSCNRLSSFLKSSAGMDFSAFFMSLR